MRRRVFVGKASAMAAGALVFPSARGSTGVGRREIVVGNTASLSGPLAAQVKVILSGARLALDAQNEKGGIGGRQINLVSLDDEFVKEKAVANYKSLLDQHGVFAFFGCVGSATLAAAASLLEQSGAPSVGGLGVSDSARQLVPHSYFVRATYEREIQVLIEHLTTIGVTRIAIAYLENPREPGGGGVEAVKLFERALALRKLRPTGAVSVSSDGSNTASAAAALAQSRPQAVLMFLGGPFAGEFMKAIYSTGAAPMFYGMSVVSGEITAKITGQKTTGLAISQVIPYPWNPIDDVTREYRRLADKAQVPIGYGSFEGYLNALVMVEGLTRAGQALTRTSFHGAMRSLKLRVAGLGVDFTRGSNTGSNLVDMVRVTAEGRFVR